MATDAKLTVVRVARALVVFIYAVVLIDLVLMTVAFFLRLFGASTDAEFTQWVYRSVERVMDPFRGIFPPRELSDQSILDVSLLFAMIIYSIVALALHALVEWLAYRSRVLRARVPETPAPPPAPSAPSAPSAPIGAPAPTYPAPVAAAGSPQLHQPAGAPPPTYVDPAS